MVLAFIMKSFGFNGFVLYSTAKGRYGRCVVSRPYRLGGARSGFASRLACRPSTKKFGTPAGFLSALTVSATTVALSC